MARTPTPNAVEPTLEQPRGGGSYLRQEDGALKMIEGPVDPDEALAEVPTPPEPPTPPAPPAEGAPSAGAEQREG